MTPGTASECRCLAQLEPGNDALEVCDGCEQFIMGDEQRIKTPSAESISSLDGIRVVPGRVFHTGCYGPWNERLKATADSNEPVEVAPSVNAPNPTAVNRLPDRTRSRRLWRCEHWMHG